MSTLSRVIFDPDATPPTTPLLVTATALSQTAIRVTWAVSTDAGGSGLAGYRVYRSLTSGGTYSLISGTLSTASLSYDDSTLSAGTTRWYRVSAVDNNNNESAQSTAVSGTTQSGTAPTYTPLYRQNFETGTLGTAFDSWTTWRTGETLRTVYDNTRSFSGTRSAKFTMLSTQPGVQCNSGGNSAGGHWYGGVSSMPQPLAQGDRAWYRWKFFFPSTFSFGYAYSGGGSTPCGGDADGYGHTKFMMFGNSTGGRLYLQLSGSLRSVSYVQGLAVEADMGIFGEFPSATIPRDQWVDLQIEVLAHSSSGYVRLWIDGTYQGQINGPTLGSSSATLYEWGIGDYWNGHHYTDGAAGRSNFWGDEVVIATSRSGFGIPNTTDSGGRAYISPSTLVSDFG